MPLPLVAGSGRADRFSVDRAGTVRDTTQLPYDMVLEDLSDTGCMLTTEVDLPIGSSVSIAVPGLGMRPAEIVRVDNQRYGCAFLAPLDPGSILAVGRGQQTVAKVSFSRMPSHEDVDELVNSAEASAPKYPARQRVVIIVGSSLALWTGILAGIYAIFG
jgi:hypothetical protein